MPRHEWIHVNAFFIIKKTCHQLYSNYTFDKIVVIFQLQI